MQLTTLINGIEPVGTVWMQRALDRQLELTKPPGSLGRLEEIANRLAAIQQTLTPDVARAKIVVFAADHGVCEEGVNPYPQAVSAQMVANYLSGGAAINALAGVAGADLEIVNMGLASAAPAHERLVDRSVGPGTKNFCRGPAMSREDAVAALLAGAERARQAADDGYRLVGFGEMGIGNTTAASAVTAALTALPASAVIGRGTGADDACLSRKRFSGGTRARAARPAQRSDWRSLNVWADSKSRPCAGSAWARPAAARPFSPMASLPPRPLLLRSRSKTACGITCLRRIGRRSRGTRRCSSASDKRRCSI